ncbi:MAG: DUF3501 family protein [Candidatus Protistobacter heckmanni]|nr:DUF3501 family protein [Candidatus Protistobacter heckmanni]
MPRKITRESLMTLEAYHRARKDIRGEVMANMKLRTVHLGENLPLIFEDEMLMRYQIQEILRVEKIFDNAGIQEELDAYNPLVPDGTNFKATMMIEYAGEAERRSALSRLHSIEDRMFLEVEGQPCIHAVADEDLESSTEEKTSAVHFLRYELTPPMIAALKAGAQIKLGCEHKEYPFHVDGLPPETLAALLKDLA